jgi:proline racemase
MSLMRIREVFECVDLHAAGEPLRLITSGYPPLPPGSLLDRRQYLETHLDHYRQWLMYEPWGHEDMYGCLLLPAERPDSAAGLLFMHNAGYSTMCGHATIAVTTWLVDSGQIPVPSGSDEVAVKLDVPSGQVTARAFVSAGRVESVEFENVPAFARALDAEIEVDGRSFTVDVGWGGAFYALIPAARLGTRVTPENVDVLRHWFWKLKPAVEQAGLVEHPLEPRLSGLYGVIFTDPPAEAGHYGRQLTIFADGEADRSPCGSCVSARLAVLAARKEIETGTELPIESVLGTVFTGTWLGPSGSQVGPYPAMRTTVRGEAYVTGFRRFYRDPADPVGAFLIR